MRKYLEINLSESDVTRFLSRRPIGVDENGCINWQGNTNKDGYGVFKIKGVRYLANRVAAKIAGLPIDQNTCACHRCDNPTCVNPEHIFIGTLGDNIADMNAKGRRVSLSGDDHPSRKNPSRLARGSACGTSKLTEENVREIKQRLRDGERHTEIAKSFGVTGSNIDAIAAGKSWRHIQ